jgi:xylulokinase
VTTTRGTGAHYASCRLHPAIVRRAHSTRLVGLDVGTSSIKGVAIDRDGAVVEAAERPLALSVPRPGWREQDPEAWWRAATDVLRACGAEAAAGIGLSGQMHGLVALDAHDRPLRPAILWNDGRAATQCQEIEALHGLDGLVALTGNRALIGCTAPSLLWVRENEPALHAQIRSILLPKDYIRLRLCGRRATDAVDASGTLLFDVARRRWSDTVVGSLAIDPAWLPPVLESPERSGASGGVPVAAGAGDTAAAAIGAGVIGGRDPISIELGTSGNITTALDAYVAEPRGRAHAYCHATPGAWTLLETVMSAGGSLRWLLDVFGADARFEPLVAEAARWEPGAGGLRFAPDLTGRRMPDADPDARGAFVGLGAAHDRGALVRAVLEGVAFALATGTQLLGSLAGTPRAARVSGGGTRADLWLEVIASVLDLPLEVCRDAGSASGAALLGGVAAGVWESVPEAVASCVRVSRTVEPRGDWVERYAELHAAHRALTATLSAAH